MLQSIHSPSQTLFITIARTLPAGTDNIQFDVTTCHCHHMEIHIFVQNMQLLVQKNSFQRNINLGRSEQLSFESCSDRPRHTQIKVSLDKFKETVLFLQDTNGSLIKDTVQLCTSYTANITRFGAVTTLRDFGPKGMWPYLNKQDFCVRVILCQRLALNTTQIWSNLNESHVKEWNRIPKEPQHSGTRRQAAFEGCHRCHWRSN